MVAAVSHYANHLKKFYELPAWQKIKLYGVEVLTWHVVLFSRSIPKF
jgi:hypothetical protein